MAVVTTNKNIELQSMVWRDLRVRFSFISLRFVMMRIVIFVITPVSDWSQSIKLHVILHGMSNQTTFHQPHRADYLTGSWLAAAMFPPIPAADRHLLPPSDPPLAVTASLPGMLMTQANLPARLPSHASLYASFHRRACIGSLADCHQSTFLYLNYGVLVILCPNESMPKWANC